MNPGFHKTGINLDASKIMTVRGHPTTPRSMARSDSVLVWPPCLQGIWNKLPEQKKEQYGEDFLKSTIDLQTSFTQGMVFDPRHVVKVRLLPTPARRLPSCMWNPQAACHCLL